MAAITWTGKANDGGNWNTAANWRGATTPPGATDDAIIESGPDIAGGHITTDPASIRIATTYKGQIGEPGNRLECDVVDFVYAGQGDCYMKGDQQVVISAGTYLDCLLEDNIYTVFRPELHCLRGKTIVTPVWGSNTNWARGTASGPGTVLEYRGVVGGTSASYRKFLVLVVSRGAKVVSHSAVGHVIIDGGTYTSYEAKGFAIFIIAFHWLVSGMFINKDSSAVGKNWLVAMAGIADLTCDDGSNDTHSMEIDEITAFKNSTIDLRDNRRLGYDTLDSMGAKWLLPPDHNYTIQEH